MEFLETLKTKLLEIDTKFLNGSFKPTILKNEEKRKLASEKWMPVPLRIYKFFFRDYEVPDFDQTVPLPTPLYNFFYHKTLKPKQLLTIANVLLNYAKSSSDISIALQELRIYKGLGAYHRKLMHETSELINRDGTELYNAFNQTFGKLMDSNLINSLETGDRTNRTKEMLTSYIDDLDYDIKNASQIKKALAYPVLVLVLIGAMCLGVKFVLYDAMFGDAELEVIPSGFRPALAVANVLTNPLQILKWLVILYVLKQLPKYSRSIKCAIEVFTLRMPGLGSFLVTKDLCYFFRNLYNYVDRGATNLDAHSDSLKAIKLETLRIVFEEKTQLLIQGNTFTDTYKDISYLPDSIKIELSSSERSGSVADTLYRLQMALRASYQEATDSLIASLPTYSILIAGVALMVLILPAYGVLMNFDKYLS